jgi:hypothetical protein
MNKTSEQVVELVDANGRVIPVPGVSGVVDADRKFYLTQPCLDYTLRHARLQEFYGCGMQFASVSEFADRCEAAIERIASDPRIANLLKGPHFPFIIPQLQGDLGTLLDGTVVLAMERSYCAQFPNRKFYNYRRDQLTGNAMAVPGTRQERLIEAMTKGLAYGVYFPCLQGFDLAGAREMTNHLPESLVLSGIEVLAVITAYPDITGVGVNTLGLDMSALALRACPEYSPFFWASDVNAMFGGRRNGDVGGDHCGGVTILG